MTEQYANKIKEALWLHYNDNLNETQYYYRMNQAGISKEDADAMFDCFSEYVNAYKSKQNKYFCSILLLTICLLVVTTVWSFII